MAVGDSEDSLQLKADRRFFQEGSRISGMQKTMAQRAGSPSRLLKKVHEKLDFRIVLKC